MNLYPEVSSGSLGVKRKVTQREVVLLTIQSIGGFVDLVAKWQEFDYLLGRVDRPSHMYELPQLHLCMTTPLLGDTKIHTSPYQSVSRVPLIRQLLVMFGYVLKSKRFACDHSKVAWPALFRLLK